ncbi:MAG TPA: NAD(P)/FAD-dependent oxidoreductase [Acidimicrobiales bacterium]|nr:NAD(P)/FAD-dependent oxidoreductase [Acidimicrobiales bacterium]
MTEHLDVLVVGAGLSGIGAGHHLQTECPWASYAIFEARDAIGGTWDLFRYPGIRSDSDMFTLGYSFRPWDDDAAIADGASILRYIRETAAEEGIDRHIRYHHRIVRAAWSSDDARWHVTAERTDTGETVEVTCGFLFSCSGYYRYDQGHKPDFPGQDRFGGRLVHPQFWPEDLDVTGKRVVVIGSGATAITLIPSLARTAAHVTMLQRSPTYIMSLPAQDGLANLARRVLPARASGPLVRWYKALTTQAFYQLSQRRPALVKRILRKGLERQLPPGYDIDTHFSPTYDPWDQRLCLVPDGDLFRAIKAGDASVVTDRIDTFTETGLRLESGAELDADVVVTATGLEMLFLGGIELTVDGEPVDVPSTLVYKGMMLEGVPNLATAVGYTNASWTLKCELTCEYVTRLVNHLRTSGLRECTPVNDDTAMTTEPLLGLSSGYVRRAADRLPKQGDRFPWKVYQSYLRDYRALRMSDIDDGVMRFGNPAPAGVPSATSAAGAAAPSEPAGPDAADGTTEPSAVGAP